MLRAASPDWFGVAIDLGLGAGLRPTRRRGSRSTAWTSCAGSSSSTGSSCRRWWGSRPSAFRSRSARTARSRSPMPSSRAWPSTSAVRPRRARLAIARPDGSPMRRQKFGEWLAEDADDPGLPTARFHDTAPHLRLGAPLRWRVGAGRRGVPRALSGRAPADLPRTLCPGPRPRPFDVQAAFGRALDQEEAVR